MINPRYVLGPLWLHTVIEKPKTKSLGPNPVLATSATPVFPSISLALDYNTVSRKRRLTCLIFIAICLKGFWVKKKKRKYSVSEIEIIFG